MAFVSSSTGEGAKLLLLHPYAGMIFSNSVSWADLSTKLTQNREGINLAKIQPVLYPGKGQSWFKETDVAVIPFELYICMTLEIKLEYLDMGKLD